MPVINPVILLARERAQFRFSVLAASMLQDAAASIAQAMPSAASPAQQKTVYACRDFLTVHGDVFMQRLLDKYGSYLERGMQTMYCDLRPGLRNISVDALTLVEEEAVLRQMEVERRVLKLRDADQQSLARLNLMIAQLHDASDARERENPFRPYLMARALHDVLTEMAATTDVCTMLFDHLSGALASHLPEYFTAILDVFESNGLRARLIARPSAMSRRDRNMLRSRASGAGQHVQSGAVNTMLQSGAGQNTSFATTVFQSAGAQNTVFDNMPIPSASMPASPLLVRILDVLPSTSPATAPQPSAIATLEPAAPDAQTVLQDFVWKVFNQSAPGRAPANPRYQDGVSAKSHKTDTPVDRSQTLKPLFARLTRMQKDMAGVNSQEIAHELASRLNLQVSLAGEKLDESERIYVEMVSTLFNFIGNERALRPSFRMPILQLQAPFMKAVLLAPELLLQPDHPARQLVNRMVSVATGLSSSSPLGQQIRQQMQRVVDDILRKFNQDAGVFSDALDDFNQAIEHVLVDTDAEAGRAQPLLNAMAADDPAPDQAAQIGNALRERLLGVQTDPRVKDFILSTWSRVLSHVAARTDLDTQLYLSVVPDLLWSVQSVGVAERSRMMRLILNLVQRIKAGLQLIDLGEEQTRAVMDVLMELHTRSLRPPVDGEQIRPLLTMTELHRQFASLDLAALMVSAQSGIHAPTISGDQLQKTLQQHDVQVHLHFDNQIGTLLDTDMQWLALLQPGTPVECWMRRDYAIAVLVSVDVQKQFYLFRLAGKVAEPGLLLFSSIALVKAIRAGSVCLIESAPVFDRAMASLLDAAGIA